MPRQTKPSQPVSVVAKIPQDTNAFSDSKNDNVSCYKVVTNPRPDVTSYSYIDAVVPESLVNIIYKNFNPKWVDLYDIVSSNGRTDPDNIVLSVVELLKIPKDVLVGTGQISRNTINWIYNQCLARAKYENPDLVLVEVKQG